MKRIFFILMLLLIFSYNILIFCSCNPRLPAVARKIAFETIERCNLSNCAVYAEYNRQCFVSCNEYFEDDPCECAKGCCRAYYPCDSNDQFYTPTNK